MASTLRPVRATLLLGSLLVLLSACADKPPLVPPPAAFELSGTWLLVPELSGEVPPLRQPMDAELVAPGGPRQRPRDFLRGDLAFLHHDLPVLHAERMTIEQNQDSMGIDYDSGPYRDISWGRRERGLWRVFTGWDDGVLVIRSEASDVTTVERMRLAGNRLEVEIAVDGQGRDFEVVRVFERAAP